jgi:hypothetical protein
MKSLLAVLLLLSACSAGAQTFTRSSLPINAAPILQQTTAYGTVNNSVLLVGKFSSPGQALNDIASVDSSGSIECLQNNSDGTFSAPVISPVGLSLPVSVARRITVSGAAFIVIGGQASLQLFSLLNCSVTGSTPINLANVVSVSDVIPGLVNGDAGFLLLTQTGLFTFDTVTNVIDEATIPPAPPIPGNPPATPSSIGGEYIQAGSFGNYQFSLVQIPPNSGSPSSSFIVGDVTAGNLTLANAFQDFSGAQLMGFIFTSSGIAAGSWTNCSTCNEAQIFLDSVVFDSQAQASVTPITSFDLPGVPEGLAIGNFLGDETDIAIATNVNQTVSNNVFWYRYLSGSTPTWSPYASNINAGGPISAIDHGILSAGSDFVVTIVGANAVVFGPTAVTEQGAAPPPAPSITITPANQSGPAGTTFTYQFNLANFLTVPTLSISCPVPVGTCTNDGTSLIVTTSAPSSSTTPMMVPTTPMVTMSSFTLMSVLSSVHSPSVMMMATIVVMIMVAVIGKMLVRVSARKLVKGLAFAGVLICLSSCGSSVSPSAKPTPPVAPPPVTSPPASGGTPSGTYTIQISAVGSQATASVQLTIQ